jgi:hypothetical protein
VYSDDHGATWVGGALLPEAGEHGMPGSVAHTLQLHAVLARGVMEECGVISVATEFMGGGGGGGGGGVF